MLSAASIADIHDFHTTTTAWHVEAVNSRKFSEYFLKNIHTITANIKKNYCTRRKSDRKNKYYTLILFGRYEPTLDPTTNYKFV